MASDAALPVSGPAPDPPGSAARQDLARSVSADLAAIFGDAAASPGGRVPISPIVRPTPGRSKGAAAAHRMSTTGLGGLAAAALAGVAAGALLVRPAPAPHPAAPRPTALGDEMTPPLQAPKTFDVALAAAQPLHTRRPVAHRHVRAAPQARTASGCCSYAEAQAADQELRQAYEAAIRAGASPGEILTAYDRWSDVRRREAADPHRLAAAYRDIARDLDRATAGTRAQPPRTVRARFRPPYPAWWS